MAYIKQYIHGETLNVFEFDGPMTIGRGADCDIVVDDPTISGLHARIEKRPDGLYLVDQNSTNGCMVLEQKLTEFKLLPGTAFRLGTCEFEFLEHLPNELEKTLKIKKSWIPGVYYTSSSKSD